MAISPARARRERAALLKQIERDLKSKDRARLLALKEQIKSYTRSRRQAIARALATCRATRAEVPSQKQVIEWQRTMKRESRSACARDLSAARKLSDPIARARAEHAAEAKHQRDLRRIERGVRDKERGRAAPHRRERRRESDDEVRGNIPPELVYLFERVKRGIKGSDRKSRTEEFLEYVEAHPDEQWEGLEARTDDVIRELERRQAMPNPKKRSKGKKRRRRPRKVVATQTRRTTTRTRVVVRNPRKKPPRGSIKQGDLFMAPSGQLVLVEPSHEQRVRTGKSSAASRTLDLYAKKNPVRLTAAQSRKRFAQLKKAGCKPKRVRLGGESVVIRRRACTPPPMSRAKNPRRPPKRWWDACLRSVAARKYARDPAAVCGAAWWRRPPAERERIVRRLERGSNLQRRTAVAIAKAESKRADRRPPRRSNPGGMSSEEAIAEYERTHWGEKGRQRIATGRAADPTHGKATILGERLVDLTYETIKKGDRTWTQYTHEFGDRRGRGMPKLAYNAGGLIVVDGDYTVKKGGITG